MGIQLRRRFQASGSPSKAHASGSRWNMVSTESPPLALVEEVPVASSTLTVPEAFAVTSSLGGLKLQDELAGSSLQANVKVPLDPFKGTRLSM